MSYDNPLLTFMQKKNMANRTQVYNLKIWINARGVFTENILMKYQKQGKTVGLNTKDALMLLHTALRKSWIY